MNESQIVCINFGGVSYIPRPPDKPWVVGFSIRNIKNHIYVFVFLFLLFRLFSTASQQQKEQKFDRIFDHHALYQTDDVALVLVVLVGDDDE